MAKIDNDEVEAAAPEELVSAAFSRCQNYPKERAGVLGLAQGLKRASEVACVPMAGILRACAESSVYCPTDADLLAVAHGLRKSSEHHTPAKTDKCSFALCDGSGWRPAFHMHTKHGSDASGAAWVDKELITQTQYDDLKSKLDWQKQQVYESRYRCRCHPPRQEEQKAPRKRETR